MREHRPIIALDFPSFEAVKEFLALFPAEESLYLKVGMELYYAAGPEIVSYLKGLGHSVFWISNFMTFLIQSSQP